MGLLSAHIMSRILTEPAPLAMFQERQNRTVTFVLLVLLIMESLLLAQPGVASPIVILSGSSPHSAGDP